MEIIYYTIAALILYGVSDYILNSIEIRMGKRLPHRSFYFFIIITILSLVSFSAIRTIMVQKEVAQQTTNTPIKQSDK
jgi:p-aminobenzoyl-glutamate transporter AbgT